MPKLEHAPTTDEPDAWLVALMRAQNLLNTAPMLDQDAHKAFSQGISQWLLGMVPGAGIAGAAGYTPTYGSNYFIPSGVERGPNIKENIDAGNYGQAAMQGLGILPDLGYVAAAGAMVPKAAQKGMIRAFHGSPYDFNEFSLDKIGTGEGAQAYGHGLYFAENENVAAAYKHAVSGRKATNTFDGVKLDNPDSYWETIDKLNNSGDWPLAKALEYYSKQIEPDQSLRIKQMRDWFRNDTKMMDAINRMEPIIKTETPPGRMYEVAIHSDPEKFLDWDKPLISQPQTIRNIAEKVSSTSSVSPLTLNDKGQRLWEKMRNPFPAKSLGYENWSTSGPADYLAKQGITGIKYLDQGSRGSGQGTRNYVVFDPKTIEILRKYGLLGMTGGGGALLGNRDDGT